MFRTFGLSKEHFAAKWVIPADDSLNDRKAVNQLAIDYATTPDGPEKEALFLRLVECFHGYLIKYTNMVTRGQLPSLKTPAGKDAAQFLRTLLPKGKPANHVVLLNVCRTLHLAFKQATTDDVYDVMVLCFLKACRRYDPFYTDKVRQVCEVIDGPLATQQQFTALDVTGALGFDALNCLRLLVRKQYLASVHGPKKKVVGYQRGPIWPPEQAFFEAGPVGFTYFASMWFRYYLNDHISQVMDELETQDGVLQLDHRGSSGRTECSLIRDSGVPSADGAYTDAEGNSWAADTSLMDSQLDVGLMTDAWVRDTDDKLFRCLTPQERLLLQMQYRDEANWVEIGAALNCTAQTARQLSEQVMSYLKARAKVLNRPALHERTKQGTGGSDYPPPGWKAEGDPFDGPMIPLIHD